MEEKESEETPWIDAWIRWERDSKEIYNEEEDVELSPGAPTDSFVFRYSGFDDRLARKEEDFIELELKGFDADSEQIWNSTGLTLWRSSHYLCEYLLASPELSGDGQRTLEVRAC